MTHDMHDNPPQPALFPRFFASRRRTGGGLSCVMRHARPGRDRNGEHSDSPMRRRRAMTQGTNRRRPPLHKVADYSGLTRWKKKVSADWLSKRLRFGRFLAFNTTGIEWQRP